MGPTSNSCEICLTRNNRVFSAECDMTVQLTKFHFFFVKTRALGQIMKVLKGHIKKFTL